MTHDSQRIEILRILAKGETLTTWLAFERLGCTTLSQRCTELRKQRIPVMSRMVRRGKSRVAEYWIEPARRANVRRELANG